jgi:deoxyribose-phosphate aldolase
VPPRTDITKALESTLLRATARGADIDALCDAAAADHCAAVVVLPVWVARAKARLAGRDVRVCAAISYPFGAETPHAKLAAVEQAIRDGAGEVEVVAALHAFAAADWAVARDELAAIVRLVALLRAGGGRSVAVKAVIETCYLDEAGIKAAGNAMAAAGCDFVVTSTGMGPEGATERGVSLLRNTLPPTVQVKAAGGILSLADAEGMLRAGAARLGSNAASRILEEAAAAPRR